MRFWRLRGRLRRFSDMASQNLFPLFQRGFTKQIILAYKLWDPKWRNIFHVGTSDSRIVDMQNWSSYGVLPQFRVPGGQVQQAAIAPSFPKRYVMRSWGLGDSFASEDIDDDLYGVIHKVMPAKAGAMAHAFQNLMEEETSQYFIVNGYASGNNVAGMFDGVSLFNVAHPLSSTQPYITWANRPATDVDLSVASLQVAETNLRTQKPSNNIGYIENRPRAIIINPSLRFVAKQVIDGFWETASANRTENALQSVEIIDWAWFQKSGATGTNNAWFEVGDEHFLDFLMHTAYRTETAYDINTSSQIVTAHCRFDLGATDARGTFGSSGL